MTFNRNRILPLILSAVIIVADQITKAAIVAKIDLYSIGASFGGDLLRIIHTRNPAVAFSLGHSLPPQIRTVLFIVLPLIVLGAVLVFFLRSDDFTTAQRWAVAAVIGGGLGNLIDRIFRPMGVVDFVDVKFFGIFGLERWPTFNVADAAVVVGGLLLAVTLLLPQKKSS